MQNSISEQQVVRALAALGNTTRLRLFRLLVRAGREGLNIGQLQQLLEQPASTLAHHLGKLTGAGLVIQTRNGREVICTTAYERMNEVLDYLTGECCGGIESSRDDSAA
jgi:ArsR family transcriptional regulator, arsenate/arsenite/antimonite-responsive transcriptional repressor